MNNIPITVSPNKAKYEDSYEKPTSESSDNNDGFIIFIYIIYIPYTLYTFTQVVKTNHIDTDGPNNIHTTQIKSHIVIPAENLTTPCLHQYTL